MAVYLIATLDTKGPEAEFLRDRLIELGLNALYHVPRNPLPWLDDMLNAVEHTNFFENRATEYSKASTAGTWEEAFDDLPSAAGNMPLP